MKEWIDLSFKETDNPELFIVSYNRILFPKDFFKKIGIENVIDVKRLIDCDYQEMKLLLNCYHLVTMNGTKIEKVETIDDYRKKKLSFMRRTQKLSDKTGVPWHIAKITEFITNDKRAIEYLLKLKTICETKPLETGIKEALLSNCLEARIEAIEKYFGMEVLIHPKYKYREDAVRWLAWYILTQGEYVTDIRETCKLPKAEKLYNTFSTRLHRAIQADVPGKIAKIMDNVQDDYDAIHYLRTIRRYAQNTKTGNADMLSSFQDIRKEAVISGFNDEIKNHLRRRFETSPELSQELGNYILNDGQI